MGEMLQDDGNPWRGMVYGMTSRLGWSEKSNPALLWKAWKEFSIDSTSMIGYWSSKCPVKTDNPRVLATVYHTKGMAVIALASWAEQLADIKLQVDFKALGLDENRVHIVAPAIQGFQEARTFSAQESIPVEKNKGWILVVREN
jgi:Family of unknown function (DUF6067)